MITSVFAIVIALLHSVPTYSHDVHPASVACGSLKNFSPPLLVSFPGDDQYTQDISHATIFTTQDATCSVQPRNVAEIQSIFHILTETRSPFAIKSRGHANNPTHSSTLGVQIALTQFNQFQYDEETEKLTIGPGLAWDEVYALLEPLGRMAVGGRISGVGVGGFLLGGGFSYKTNQYGLASDTIVEYELVTPAGKHLIVNAKSEPELFWGLQGGLNNFGIVTSFTLTTHPQTSVYAGTISVPGDSMAFKKAVQKFDETIQDPKASIMAIYAYSGNQLTAMATLFYDAPMAPAGIFDDFLALENVSGTMQTMTFLQFIKDGPSLPAGLRVLANSVPIRRYTTEIIDHIQRLTEERTSSIQKNTSCLFLAGTMELFLPSSFTKTPPGGSAYLHTPPHAFTPFNLATAWTDPSDDQFMIDFMASFASTLEDDAKVWGLTSGESLVYSNYALESVPLERIYGEEGLMRLARLRKEVDPEDLMSLAGGFIVPISNRHSETDDDDRGVQFRATAMPPPVQSSVKDEL